MPPENHPNFGNCKRSFENEKSKENFGSSYCRNACYFLL